MALNRIEKVLNSELDALEHKGLLKRAESVITAVLQPKANRGPRNRAHARRASLRDRLLD